MGLKVNRSTTQGLASSIRNYIAKGEIFTKPAPNTYGLIEFGQVESAPTEPIRGVRLIDLDDEK